MEPLAPSVGRLMDERTSSRFGIEDGGGVEGDRLFVVVLGEDGGGEVAFFLHGTEDNGCREGDRRIVGVHRRAGDRAVSADDLGIA